MSEQRAAEKVDERPMREGTCSADTCICDSPDLGGYPSEAAMKELEVPRLSTIHELAAYIDGLIERPHDYGTGAYAMSLAAHAAFRFVARRVGAVSYQANVACSDLVRRILRINNPFWIVDCGDMLDAQVDILAKTLENLQAMREWAKEEAAKRLNEHKAAEPPFISAETLAHWKRLAETDDPYPFVPTGAEELFDRLAALKDDEDVLMDALQDAVLGSEDEEELRESLDLDEAVGSLEDLLRASGFDVIVLHPTEPEEMWSCNKCGSTFKAGWLAAVCPNPECESTDTVKA